MRNVRESSETSTPMEVANALQLVISAGFYINDADRDHRRIYTLTEPKPGMRGSVATFELHALSGEIFWVTVGRQGK